MARRRRIVSVRIYWR